MPAFAATAPGKIILFGEHAVVYGHPAIAAPVLQACARAVVTANLAGRSGSVRLIAEDIRLDRDMAALPEDHPLAIAVHETARRVGVDAIPACTVRITSTIPLAAGMGSGTSVAVAMARALSAFLGSPLDDETVSAVAFRVDQRHHGTPSGIDNSVISYAQTIWFVRGQPILPLRCPVPLAFVIGNTGIHSATGTVVQDLRERFQANPAPYEANFDAISEITTQARRCFEAGQTVELGHCMNRNHAVLQRLDVSSPALDRLVAAALNAGALGAKMSGGGRGGNMIALCLPQQAGEVARTLTAAGAVRTIETTIQ